LQHAVLHDAKAVFFTAQAERDLGSTTPRGGEEIPGSRSRPFTARFLSFAAGPTCCSWAGFTKRRAATFSFRHFPRQRPRFRKHIW
jgi:hypothetical protein